MTPKRRWPRTCTDLCIFEFPSKSTEWNSTKLDGNQDHNVLYQVCVFQTDRKNKICAQPPIYRDIFDFWSETVDRNSTKLESKQNYNVLYQVCVLRLIGKTRDPPGLWFDETCSTSPLKPLNKIQRNLTGSKITTSSTKFVFCGLVGKQDGRPGLW